jgi:hypothetical protein
MALLMLALISQSASLGAVSLSKYNVDPVKCAQSLFQEHSTGSHVAFQDGKLKVIKSQRVSNTCYLDGIRTRRENCIDCLVNMHGVDHWGCTMDLLQEYCDYGFMLAPSKVQHEERVVDSQHGEDLQQKVAEVKAFNAAHKREEAFIRTGLKAKLKKTITTYAKFMAYFDKTNPSFAHDQSELMRYTLFGPNARKLRPKKEASKSYTRTQSPALKKLLGEDDDVVVTQSKAEDDDAHSQANGAAAPTAEKNPVVPTSGPQDLSTAAGKTEALFAFYKHMKTKPNPAHVKKIIDYYSNISLLDKALLKKYGATLTSFVKHESVKTKVHTHSAKVHHAQLLPGTQRPISKTAASIHSILDADDDLKGVPTLNPTFEPTSPTAKPTAKPTFEPTLKPTTVFESDDDLKDKDLTMPTLPPSGKPTSFYDHKKQMELSGLSGFEMEQRDAAEKKGPKV